MIIVNDIHGGFQRVGGTTPDSREALRSYLLNSLSEFLQTVQREELAIVGDLFDDFEVTGRDWLDMFITLDSHLQNGCPALILVAGNHDWSPKAERVSSFQTLAAALKACHPERVFAVNLDETLNWSGSHFVAHCSSQLVFEEKLKAVWEEAEKGDTVFVHANFDNNFAAQTDHSLNVSRELAKSFVSHGIRLVFAHEHHPRRAFNDMVVVLGNQWPTSINDCLGDERKFAHRLHDDGILHPIPTWGSDRPAGYTEIDWRDPQFGEWAPGFVRVVGKASANEASDVIDAIAKLRKVADPNVFIIGNAVKVEGMVEAEALPESFEAARRFDVLEYIEQHLTGEEMKVVRGLLPETGGAS